MYSMTGYGKGISGDEQLKVSVEIKSVNHRFLDLTIKTPKGMAFTEDTLRKVVSGGISRGHVDVFVTIEDNRKEKSAFLVDVQLAAAYKDAAEQLKKLGFSNNFGVSEALRMSDVLKSAAIETDEEQMLSLVSEAGFAAIESLNAMRKTEGEKLSCDLQEKLSEIFSEVEKIKERASGIVSDYYGKLRKRIEELLADVPLNEERLINETAVFADRCSVDEEITRLFSHISQFKGLLSEKPPFGKRLDFLVQEMNREINTIGSKANDLTSVNGVMRLKNLVEMIREQIQNIE